MTIQYMICVVLVLCVAVVCFLFSHFLGYKVVALLLLMTVSLVATLFDILPVLVTAVLSALIWNFFFIPPIYTFHIDNAEDLLMFLLYFFIALVNAALTFKIRAAEHKARDKEEKEKTIKLYNTLLNSLSHELRTPISTIVGAVDTLKDTGIKLSADNEAALLSEIDKAGSRLNRQVENLLNMSRLETGILQLKLDWCDINELIGSIIQKFLTEEHKHTILFQPDEHLPLYKLDAGLIEQVMQNIIHNAIQYTADYSVISIHVQHREDCCIITIADNGYGFPEEEMAFVFDKFYRLAHTKAGGSGLGLSIAKGFVEAHKGSILLKNKAEGGAEFTIRIPAQTSFINNLKHE